MSIDTTQHGLWEESPFGKNIYSLFKTCQENLSNHQNDNLRIRLYRVVDSFLYRPSSCRKLDLILEPCSIGGSFMFNA